MPRSVEYIGWEGFFKCSAGGWVSEPPTPVVMWHGAGDWSASAPMERMRRAIAENTPNGTYIYSVAIGGDGGQVGGPNKVAHILLLTIICSYEVLDHPNCS